MNHSRPKIVATIQARMTSTRLPGKVLLPAVGKPMLELMVERLKRVPALAGIVIATTTNATDDDIERLARKLGVGCYRGSEHNVLSRVLEAAQSFDIDVIVETTGDCPLIDPGIVQQVIDLYVSSGKDYASNILERTYPIGMDTQVFSTKVLADVAGRTNDPEDLEHVSVYIYRHPDIYSLANLAAPAALRDPMLRLTLDTPEDYQVVGAVFDRLYPGTPDFRLADVLALLREHPKLRAVNDAVQHRWVKR